MTNLCFCSDLVPQKLKVSAKMFQETPRPLNTIYRIIESMDHNILDTCR
jgi:hypothetical protein